MNYGLPPQALYLWDNHENAVWKICEWHSQAFFFCRTSGRSSMVPRNYLLEKKYCQLSYHLGKAGRMWCYTEVLIKWIVSTSHGLQTVIPDHRVASSLHRYLTVQSDLYSLWSPFKLNSEFRKERNKRTMDLGCSAWQQYILDSIVGMFHNINFGTCTEWIQNYTGHYKLKGTPCMWCYRPRFPKFHLFSLSEQPFNFLSSALCYRTRATDMAWPSVRP